jgi:hypothetical protein
MIHKMSAEECCEWLSNHGLFQGQKKGKRNIECYDYQNHKYRLAACAFAARDYLVQENLILQWTQELDQVREFPWDKNPIDWLRAAVMVLNEKEMKK